MPNNKVQKRSADTSMYLTIDTIFSILTNLPVKSLLRFKSVAISWNAIISDDKFKNIHHDQSKVLCREKLLFKQRSTGHFEFRDLESPQLLPMEKQLSPLERFKCEEIWCSCDGLVLLKDYNSYKDYVLWNPSTREYRILESCPYLNNNDEYCMKACGMCYDSNLDDYKIILICDLFYVVYSLNKGRWAKKTSFPCPRVFYNNLCSRGTSISTKGCVFWSLTLNSISDRIYCSVPWNRPRIIYYDVKSDEVEQLPLPEFVRVRSLFGLTTLKDCPSLYGGTYINYELDIWILEQDSWKWVMNVCNLPVPCTRFVDNINMWCSEIGDRIIFYGVSEEEFFIYYPKLKQFVNVLVPDKSKYYVIPKVAICLDSFYFPRRNIKEEATVMNNIDDVEDSRANTGDKSNFIQPRRSNRVKIPSKRLTGFVVEPG
ncbi:F-box protein CPR1-like [Lycium barbarum]|uniref:F-box protein CPR1-like n=1 Tax=Lycium barbarum TaxID=112863 RepID=UPI00293E0CA3|nr:F-box protein CPR1-like [Lycium barbarum]